MFSFLKPKPEKKLQKELEKTLEQAMQAQRNGKLELYGELSKKAIEMDEKLKALRKSN